MEDDLKPIFEKAMAEGLTLWDIAAVFGMGTSGTIFSNLIAGSAAKIPISTKFTPMPFQGKSAMRRSIEKSMSRLKVGTVDLYTYLNRIKMVNEKYTPIMGKLYVASRIISNY